MANLYFLIIAVLQSIKEISYSGGQPVILLPLTFVIAINGVKDIFEDLKRKEAMMRKIIEIATSSNELNLSAKNGVISN